MKAPRLFDVERMLWETIARSGSSEVSQKFSRLICGRDARDRAARVGVYAHAYLERLNEVLAEDYPRVATAVGVGSFSELVRDYVASFPSRNPSVRYLGASLPEFIASKSAFPPWLSDLARLEWARVEVFDGSDSPSIGVSDLMAVEAKAWPSIRFERINAFQLIHSKWSLAQLWSDTDVVAGAFEPSGSAIRVWRAPDYQVRHAPMDTREAAALELLINRANFSSICESFADLPEEDAAREATSLLARWLADGLIARFF